MLRMPPCKHIQVRSHHQDCATNMEHFNLNQFMNQKDQEVKMVSLYLKAYKIKKVTSVLLKNSVKNLAWVHLKKHISSVSLTSTVFVS